MQLKKHYFIPLLGFDGLITIDLFNPPTTSFLLLPLDTKMEDCLMDDRLRLRRRSGRVSEEEIEKECFKEI